MDGKESACPRELKTTKLSKAVNKEVDPSGVVNPPVQRASTVLHFNSVREKRQAGSAAGKACCTNDG